MIRVGNSKSLCNTCVSSEDCSLVAVQESTTMFCEEFRNEDPPEKKPEKDDESKSDDMSIINKDAPMGLCKNCDHFKECTLPKDSGGVWHCEEYE